MPLWSPQSSCSACWMMQAVPFPTSVFQHRRTTKNREEQLRAHHFNSLHVLYCALLDYWKMKHPILLARPNPRKPGRASMPFHWHVGSGNHSLQSLLKACLIFHDIHDICEAMNLRQMGCERDPFCPVFRFPMTSGHGMRLASNTQG